MIRISGQNAAQTVETLTHKPVPPPRNAVLRRLYSPVDDRQIDQALVLFFVAPASFTGEDCVELHIHGGGAVIAATLDALSRLTGLRSAEAGEFTRRAFDNDKLDLTQVEAVADLIDAETEAQRRQALRQMDGALGRMYEQWRARLMRALAYMEAELDFPEEEDIDQNRLAHSRESLVGLLVEMRQHLADANRGERLREGVTIAIIGPPNAGKSSLINALARRDVAIVSHQAGTTRDVVEVQLDLAGFPVTLADTAGLREAVDEVEAEGVRRALDRAQRADLVLSLWDATTGVPSEVSREIAGRECLRIANKKDLVEAGEFESDFVVSVKTGSGMDALSEGLTNHVRRLFDAGQGEKPALTRVRHRQAVEKASEYIELAIAAPALELASEELRQAALALGRITGRVDVEDLLDVIFRDFCIGK